MALPTPNEKQNYFHVSALESGMIKLPLELVLADHRGAVDTPVISFLLRHSLSSKIIVFDLGIRRDLEAYPPATHEGIKKYFHPTVPQTVAESLLKGGIEPSAVDYVIISHLHWGKHR
jgi:hypothetical protein